LAPLNPSNTPRLYLTYTVGGEQHVQLYRYLPSGSQGTAISTIVELYAFLDSELYTTTIDSLQYSIEGSNVRIPLTWPGDPTYGTGTPTAGQEMKFVSVVGKGPDGHRVRLEQWGLTEAIPVKWRLGLGINPAMDDWFEHLQAAYTAGTFVTIGEQVAFFNQYYNFKYADDGITKARK